MTAAPARSVLIVDDEIFARDLLARIIEKQGFEVFGATTGEDGIQLYREKRPDVVFLDVLLPGIDGEDVFKYIRDIDPAASVYFITGCGDLFSPEEARALGARGFLSKPVMPDDVLRLTALLKNGEPPHFFSPEGYGASQAKR